MMSGTSTMPAYRDPAGRQWLLRRDAYTSTT
jgi:hypothetical protein